MKGTPEPSPLGPLDAAFALSPPSTAGTCDVLRHPSAKATPNTVLSDTFKEWEEAGGPGGDAAAAAGAETTAFGFGSVTPAKKVATRIACLTKGDPDDDTERSELVAHHPSRVVDQEASSRSNSNGGSIRRVGAEDVLTADAPAVKVKHAVAQLAPSASGARDNKTAEDVEEGAAVESSPSSDDASPMSATARALDFAVDRATYGGLAPRHSSPATLMQQHRINNNDLYMNHHYPGHRVVAAAETPTSPSSSSTSSSPLSTSQKDLVSRLVSGRRSSPRSPPATAATDTNTAAHAATTDRTTMVAFPGECNSRPTPPRPRSLAHKPSFTPPCTPYDHRPPPSPSSSSSTPSPVTPSTSRHRSPSPTPPVVVLSNGRGMSLGSSSSRTTSRSHQSSICMHYNNNNNNNGGSTGYTMGKHCVTSGRDRDDDDGDGHWGMRSNKLETVTGGAVGAGAVGAGGSGRSDFGARVRAAAALGYGHKIVGGGGGGSGGGGGGGCGGDRAATGVRGRASWCTGDGSTGYTMGKHSDVEERVGRTTTQVEVQVASTSKAAATTTPDAVAPAAPVTEPAEMAEPAALSPAPPASSAATMEEARKLERKERDVEKEEEEQGEEVVVVEESAKEQARDALLAFLDCKARLRLGRRVQRGAFSLWAEYCDERRWERCEEEEEEEEEMVEVEVEVEAKNEKMQGGESTARTGEASVNDHRRRSPEVSYDCDDCDVGVTQPPVYGGWMQRLTVVCGDSDKFTGVFQQTSPPDYYVGGGGGGGGGENDRPEWGMMDEKLARWLSGADEEEEEEEEEVLVEKVAHDESSHHAAWMDPEATFKNYNTNVEVDTVSSLRSALQAAEDRAAALETENRELNADLYAASVLWQETEAENQSLSRQVDEFRTETERAASTAAAAAAAVEPLLGPLRAEVEDLEQCAAAMKRQWPAAVERAARRLNGPIDYNLLRREFGITSR